MNSGDFVYKQVLNGAKAKGASESMAHQAAVKALEDFNRNKYNGRPSKLIEDAIKKAVKLTGKSQKASLATKARISNAKK